MSHICNKVLLFEINVEPNLQWLFKIKTCNLRIRIKSTSEFPFRSDNFVHVQDCFSHTTAILIKKNLQDQFEYKLTDGYWS